MTLVPVSARRACLPALLLCATLLALPVCAQAPPPASPSQAAMPLPALTPAQKARANARMAQFNQGVKALQANTSLTASQKEARFEKMKQAVNTDLTAILTPAQRAVMKQRQQQAIQQQQAMGTFQQTHKAEIGALMSLRQKLMASITPAQQKKVDALKQATQAQLEAVHNTPGLSLQAKQDKEHALVRRADAQYLTFLTPAQRAEAKQLDQMRNTLQAEAAQATQQGR